MKQLKMKQFANMDIRLLYKKNLLQKNKLFLNALI